ncbi:MAG: 5-(carboxyamino)imidazole ribonucleotide synthase [Acidimicrobiales bacterium]
MSSALPPLYRLGIVGAGQIARMTHQAAVKLGITPRLLAEDRGDSAALAAPDATFGHPDALAAFAEYCEVVTFEHERLDLGLVERLELQGTVIRPGARTMRVAFDKLYQRHVLTSRGFPIPAFAEVRGPDDLFDFASSHGYPVVIKAARAVRGQERAVWIVENPAEAMRVLAEQGGRQLLVEAHQAIMKELVVLLARRPGGFSRTYPLVEVKTNDGIPIEMRSPAAVGPRVAAEARQLAIRLAEELDSVGVIAVELFLSTDGLLINEIAARPHNAGHLTIEGTPTSQFENHVRAMLDLPLGPTWANAPALVTMNVIGGLEGTDPVNHLAEALAIEGTHVHLYGKRARPGRKLGHVTVLSDDVDQACELARRVEAALNGRRV